MLRLFRVCSSSYSTTLSLARSSVRYFAEGRTGYRSQSSSRPQFRRDRGDNFGAPSFSRNSNFQDRNNDESNFDSAPRGRRTSDDLASKLQRQQFTPQDARPQEVVKNIYQEQPEVSAMTEAQANQWRQQHDLQVIGREPPRPVTSFEHAPFRAFARQRLASKYAAPSAIQAQGWPVVLSGRDMIGSAMTGSGKTLCFILPALEHIAAQGDPKRQWDPAVVVLTPTRELALQVYETAMDFADGYNIKVACVHGGQGNRLQQMRDLRVRPNLIIATPGRLIDFVSTGIISLRNVSMWILDEADMMLDMGFEPQVRAIDGQIPPERQVLMWSATWPKKIQELAGDFLKDPVRVRAGADELTVNKQVTQHIELLEPHERMPRLLNLLETAEPDLLRKVLIFVSQKATAEWLSDTLTSHLRRTRSSLLCGALHGDIAQSERKRTLELFRAGRMNVVVATNVAARGLDISDVSLVINYDFPAEFEQYVHRIGRTGRAGRSGTAISFFCPTDYQHLDDLIDVLRRGHQEIPSDLESLSQELSRQKRATESSRRQGSRRGSFRGSSRGSSRGGGRGRGRASPSRASFNDDFDDDASQGGWDRRPQY